MCLGFPGEIVSVSDRTAVIDCWGTQTSVVLDTFAETVLPGDFVIAHEGMVVRRIPPDDVENTLELYATVLGEA
jgi:hydrogenase expression/formation protein HypC